MSANAVTPPVCTVAVSMDTPGTCFIPDTFADDLASLLAALDWARVYSTSQSYAPLAQELAAAARYARAIAGDCAAFAAAADAARTD